MEPGWERASGHVARAIAELLATHSQADANNPAVATLLWVLPGCEPSSVLEPAKNCSRVCTLAFEEPDLRYGCCETFNYMGTMSNALACES